MRMARCDGCRTVTEAVNLDVLRTAGWAIVEHAPEEGLVLLCPACQWQRSRAVEVVSEAVEAAYAARQLPKHSAGHPRTRRMGWFWS